MQANPYPRIVAAVALALIVIALLLGAYAEWGGGREWRLDGRLADLSRRALLYDRLLEVAERRAEGRLRRLLPTLLDTLSPRSDPALLERAVQRHRLLGVRLLDGEGKVLLGGTPGDPPPPARLGALTDGRALLPPAFLSPRNGHPLKRAYRAAEGGGYLLEVTLDLGVELAPFADEEGRLLLRDGLFPAPTGEAGRRGERAAAPGAGEEIYVGDGLSAWSLHRADTPLGETLTRQLEGGQRIWRKEGGARILYHPFSPPRPASGLRYFIRLPLVVEGEAVREGRYLLFVPLLLAALSLLPVVIGWRRPEAPVGVDEPPVTPPSLDHGEHARRQGSAPSLIDGGAGEGGEVPSGEDSEVAEALEEARRGRERAERSARLHRRVVGGLSRHLHATIGVLREGDREALTARAEGLARRVADLEDLEGIERDVLVTEQTPFDPRRLAATILGQHAREANEWGVSITQRWEDGLPTALVGDPGRLARVVDHLLENAVEAGGGGAVLLALEMVSAGRDRQRLRITVIDQGRGLSRERIAALMEPGVDVEEREGRATGLFFARALTEAMGGSLGVESSSERGSRFWLEVPVEVAEGEAVEGVLDESTPPTLLVADDEEATRLIIRSLLEQQGYRVVTAENGRQAVEQAETQRFEWILMDLQMPEMDGLEAALRIVERLADDAPPIIAMSATSDPREQARAREAGMRHFITKPVTLGKLHAIISGGGEAAARPVGAEPAESEGDAPAIFDSARLTEMIFDLSAVWIDKVTRTGAVSISESAERLAAMAADGDLDELRAAAHKLKGAAGNNGLERLRAVAAELEVAAREGERDQVERLLPRIEPLADDSLEALAAWKENPLDR